MCPWVTRASPVSTQTSPSSVTSTSFTSSVSSAVRRPVVIARESRERRGLPAWRDDERRAGQHRRLGRWRDPTAHVRPVVHPHIAPHRRRRVRDVLLGLGVSEAMPHPFLADGDLERAGLSTTAVRLVNPLVVGDDVLRTSLRPGLLKALAFNESHRRSGVALFEVGHVYPPSDDVLPAEFEALTVVLAGAEAPRAVAVWRELASAMGWGARLDQSNAPTGLHPTRSATLSAGRDVVGAVGEVHPDVLDAFDVTERVAILELNLSILLAAEPKVAHWKATSRFPSSDIDLAFTVPSSVTAEKVDKALRQSAGSLLVSLELFDVYRTDVDAESRSLAYRLRLQAADRTLTDSDIANVRDKCIAAVTKLGATLRA
ncbi:MAG: hypothetical protein ACO38D_11165 [Ilumatobacteraceae bacterium]